MAGLQAEVSKLRALNDQTASETADLLAALSILRQSQSQLAGDLRIKEEMLELVQQQLRWGAARVAVSAVGAERWLQPGAAAARVAASAVL